MNNRLNKLFESKKKNILNVYFTAGHPELESTVEIIKSLSEHGVDLIEIGMPYSDPLADGETIQRSSEKALANGMNLETLFAQLKETRASVNTPFILMGYYNQMIQYGEERFLAEAQASGVDGMIIPDLPMDIYEVEYQKLFAKYNMSISFLVTPQTSEERIRQADQLSNGFLYIVSQSSITGGAKTITDKQKAYFEYIKSLQLKSPRLIGFGIYNRETFQTACQYANGAIIGSAFIRAIDQGADLEETVDLFVAGIK